jgi:hypothetical protein
MIPKTLHTIGIGDQGVRPASCVCIWMERNPGWTVKLWQDKDLAGHGGYNTRQIRRLAQRERCDGANRVRWETLTPDRAWQATGSQRLTGTFHNLRYRGLSELPGHYLLPAHFSVIPTLGIGPAYAEQHWGSTRSSYGTLHLQQMA